MNLTVGLSGLQVAQRAIDLIGSNIANAATEGYHRQDLRLAAVAYGLSNRTNMGVRILDIRRAVDGLLETEIIRQQPLHGQVDRELSILQTIESMFGEVGGSGLGTTIAGFFNALSELSAQPNSLALQHQAVWAADAMATQFRELGRFLADLRQQVMAEAQQVVQQVNAFAREIADLNAEICVLNLRGGNPNVLLDRRDQALAELGRLIEIDVNWNTADGSVSVLSVGTPLAISDIAAELEVGITMGNKLGVTAKGAGVYSTDCKGGQLGGLMALYNTILPGVQDKLDTLAREIAAQVNALHVQGVGADGAFTELTGWAVDSTPLSQWNAGLSAGAIHVRVTDLETGQVVRHQVKVSLSDTIADVVAKLDGLTDAGGTTALSASLVGGALHLQTTVSTRYRFDFLPAPMAETAPADWTGSSAVTASGIYTGPANNLYTFTVSGSGSVGAGELKVDVRNQAGELVRTFDVGTGYAAGDRLDAGDGLYVAIGAGTVVNGDSFKVRLLARSDETGLLAAVGINALLEGKSARELTVRPEMLDSPWRLACASGAEMTDNANIRRIAGLAGQRVPGLGNLAPADAFRQLVTGVGQEVASRTSRLEGLQAVLRQLSARRDELGGVDVNEQAAKLLVFERMFQAMAKFMKTQDKALDTLGELI